MTGRPERKLSSNICCTCCTGVVASDGKEWVEQRRFTLRHLRDFGFGKNYMESLIMDEANEFISWLKSQESVPVNLQHAFELSVLNALWVITTGKRFQKNDDQFLSLMKSIDE